MEMTEERVKPFVRLERLSLKGIRNKCKELGYRFIGDFHQVPTVPIEKSGLKEDKTSDKHKHSMIPYLRETPTLMTGRNSISTQKLEANSEIQIVKEQVISTQNVPSANSMTENRQLLESGMFAWQIYLR